MTVIIYLQALFLLKIVSAIDPVENLQADLVTTNSVTVIWDPPLSGADTFEASISPLTDGEPTLSPQILNDTYVIFGNLRPGKTYDVTIKSFDRSDDSVSAVTTGFTTVPLAPFDIRISKFVNPILNEYKNSKNQTLMYPVYGAVVFWKQPEGGSHDGFKITVDPPNGNIRLPVSTDPSKSALMTRRIIWDILPGINYKYSVQSTSNGVLSDELIGYERMPPEIPRDIKVENLKPTSAELSWDGGHRGILDGYKVEINPQDGSIEQLSENPADSRRNVINLTPGTKYSVQIYSTSFGLLSFKPSTLDIITPPATPTGFKVLDSNETSLFIAWNKPTGNIDQYEVVYFPTERDFERLRYKTYNTQVTLTDLEPGTRYSFLIYAYTNKIFSEAEDNSAATRPNQPNNDLFCDSTADTISLKWTNANDTESIVVTYTEMANDETPIMRYVESELEQTTLLGLNPDTNYTVNLSFEKNGVASYPISVLCRTMTAPRDSEQVESGNENAEQIRPAEERASTTASTRSTTTSTENFEATRSSTFTTETEVDEETSTPNPTTEEFKSETTATTSTTEVTTNVETEQEPETTSSTNVINTTTQTTASTDKASSGKTSESQESDTKDKEAEDSSEKQPLYEATTADLGTPGFDYGFYNYTTQAQGYETTAESETTVDINETTTSDVAASTISATTTAEIFAAREEETKSDYTDTETTASATTSSTENASLVTSTQQPSPNAKATLPTTKPATTSTKTSTTEPTPTDDTISTISSSTSIPSTKSSSTISQTANSLSKTIPSTSRPSTNNRSTSSQSTSSPPTSSPSTHHPNSTKETSTTETIPFIIETIPEGPEKIQDTPIQDFFQPPARDPTIKREEIIVDIQSGFETICKPNNITVLVSKAVIGKYEKEYGPLQYNDDTGEGCRGVEHETYYRYTIAPNILSCGTLIEVNETHVNFTNTVSNRDVRENWYKQMMDSSGTVLIGRKMSNNQPLFVHMSFYCTFPLDLQVTSQFPFLPHISQQIETFNVSGVGEFSAIMQLYEDETFKVPHSSPPTLFPHESLYVGVSLLQTSQADIHMVMKRCWATPSRAHNDESQYPLIEEYCPVVESLDNKLKIIENGLSKRARWMGPVFRFISFSTVWLHCEVKVCFGSNCERTCGAEDDKNNRRRRSLGDKEIKTVMLTAGPIKLDQGVDNLVSFNSTDDTPKTTKEADVNSFNPTIILVVVMVLCVILLGTCLVIILLLAKSRKRNRNSDKEISQLEHQVIDPVVGGSVIPLSTLPRGDRAPATMTRYASNNFSWEADSCYYETASPTKSRGVDSDLPWIPRYSDIERIDSPASPSSSQRGISSFGYRSSIPSTPALSHPPSPPLDRAEDPTTLSFTENDLPHPFPELEQLPPPLPDVDYDDINVQETRDTNKM